jgi:hypothetical protein
VTVYLDRYGPQVSVERVKLQEALPHQRVVQVQGFVSDDNLLKRFVLYDRQVALLQGTEADFSQEFELPPDTTSLPFEVEDAAGNVTYGEIALDTSLNRPQGTRQGQVVPPRLLRWASLSHQGTVSDIVATSAAGKRDCVHGGDLPTIKLKKNNREDISDGAVYDVVYDNNIYIQGEIKGGSDIIKFSIDGEPLLRRKGRQIFFAYTARLQVPRPNRFRLEAEDARGNQACREIKVEYRVPKARDPNLRLRVLRESFKKCNTDSLMATIDDYFRTALLEHKRFFLVEDKSKAEGLIEGTACTRDTAKDSKTRVTARRAKSFEAFVYFVDTESADLIENVYADVYHGDLTDLDEVRPLIAGLALKLLRYFPLEQGNVLERENRQVRTSLTRGDGVRERMKLLILSTARAQTTIAEAKITQFVVQEGEESSLAIILDSGASGHVQKDDQVITK